MDWSETLQPRSARVNRRRCVLGSRDFQCLEVAWKKISKKDKKWIDWSWRGAVASRAATSEGGRETGCRSRCRSDAPHPIGFLVPSNQGSLTVWPSTGRAKSGERLETAAFKAWDESARGMLGRGKRLNCALRAFLGRAVPMDVLWGIPSKSIWNMKN
jgi:hypothetical protein